VCGSAPFVGRVIDSRGPRLTLAISFVLLATGYLGIKAVYDGFEDNEGPVGAGTLLSLVFFELLTGVGGYAGYATALNTVARSFPNRIRSTVTGMVVAGFGLSAFVFSAIARAIFPGNTSGFLLTLAVGTASPVVLGWLLIRTCPYPDHIPRATVEDGDPADSDDASLPPGETTQLIRKDGRIERPDITGLVLMRTVDFWIIFWIMSLLCGTGIMWINNVGLMARALAFKDGTIPDEKEHMKWQTLQVSTLSITSCIGRIIIGVTADFVKHRGMRRAWCIAIVATSFLISQLVGLGVQDIEHLQYVVALVGLSYGGVFGLLPTIIIEWFGIAHFSENWGLTCLSPLVAGNIFSLVFGRIFDAHSTHIAHRMHCLEGVRCYSASLYMTTFGCLCALILALVAAKRDHRYS